MQPEDGAHRVCLGPDHWCHMSHPEMLQAGLDGIKQQRSSLQSRNAGHKLDREGVWLGNLVLPLPVERPGVSSPGR